MQLGLHTLNASRSAYQSITFESSFFDAYTVQGPQAHFSVLLKVLCLFIMKVFWMETNEFTGGLRYHFSTGCLFCS